MLRSVSGVPITSGQRLLFAFNICVLIAFLFIITACSGTVPPVIQDTDDKVRIYGSPLWEWGDAVTVSADGSVCICGRAERLEMNRYDALIIKYDKDGNILWHKTWGGNDGDWALGVATDSKNNIYMAGYTYSFGEGAGDGFIVKYGPDGKILWQKTIGGECPDQINAITIDWCDNIYAVGRTSSWGVGDDDIFIAKLNPDGAIMWQRTWGGKEWDSASAVTITVGNSLLIGGTTMSFGKGKTDADAVLLKYTDDGKLVFQRIWGDDNWNEVAAIGYLQKDLVWHYSGIPNVFRSRLHNDIRHFMRTIIYDVLKLVDEGNQCCLKGLEDLQSAKSIIEKVSALGYLMKAKEYYNQALGSLRRLDKVTEQTEELKWLVRNVLNNKINRVDISIEFHRKKIKGEPMKEEDVKRYSDEAEQKNNTANDMLKVVHKQIRIIIESNNMTRLISDDAIYLAGSTQNNYSYNTFLLKYNIDGELAWRKSWGGAKTDWAKAMAIMPDETIYIAGRSDSFTEDGYDAFLIRYNGKGDLLEQTTWGGVEWDCIDAMALGRQAGEIYLVGGTENISGSWQDVKGNDMITDAKSRDAAAIDAPAEMILQDVQGIEGAVPLEYIEKKPPERNWNALFIKKLE